MKKRLFRLICALILCCSFGLGGCLGSMSGGAGGEGIDPPSDDLLNSSNNAENIIATKDNVTYYYESLEDLNADIGKEATDRNNLKHTFGDAYVFVDPGPDYEIFDHYTDTYVKYYQLVGRQVELMADILYTAINRIYLDGTIDGDINIVSKRHTFGNDDSEFNTIEAGKSESVDIMTSYDPYDNPDPVDYIDLSQPFSYAVFADLASYSWKINIEEDFGSDTATTDDPNTPKNDIDPLKINSHIFNLKYAVLGGLQFYEGYVTLNNSNKAYYAEFYTNPDVSTLNFDDDSARWECVLGLSTVEDAMMKAPDLIKEGLQMVIASALSGSEAGIEYRPDEYEEMLRKIDHLGFTTTDKLNIKNQILDKLIGTKVVKQDDSYLDDIRQSNELEVSGKTRITVNNLEELFFQGGSSLNRDNTEWHNYKGYRVVIDDIVEAAMYAIGDSENMISETSETLFPGLPRAQIIKMDSWDLMDKQAEEGDGNISEDEEIDPDDIPTDAESIKFEEKFDKFYKLIGILLMPKKVYGERTMAVKEDDQWVKDSEGNVKTTTFNVEGFILTGSDFVVLSEEDKMTSYQLNYEIHTPNKHINVESSVSEAGFVKPEPTEEAVYNSTETLDIDKQEIIEKTEDEIGDYRLLGYDGLRITDEARIIDKENNDQMIEGLKVTKEDDYTNIKISTALYHYIGVGDVNGDNGTTFAGYVLDLSKFAGNSYVVTNFPILAVNGNEEDRDAKMNILYFYLDCI